MSRLPIVSYLSLIPLYFSIHLHRHPGIFLPNVWTLPSESCLPFCLEQQYSYLCGQGGDVTGINSLSFSPLRFHTCQYSRRFIPATTKSLNELPSMIVEATELQKFKISANAFLLGVDGL